MAFWMVVKTWPGWTKMTTAEYMNNLGSFLWLPCSHPSTVSSRFNGVNENNTAWEYKVSESSESVHR